MFKRVSLEGSAELFRETSSTPEVLAETDPEQWTSDNPDLPVRVKGVREDGEVVIEGVIRLWVTPKR